MQALVDHTYYVNLNKHPAASEDYLSVLLFEKDGTIVPILLTRDQVEDAKKRADSNSEDVPVPTLFNRFRAFIRSELFYIRNNF